MCQFGLKCSKVEKLRWLFVFCNGKYQWLENIIIKKILENLLKYDDWKISNHLKKWFKWRKNNITLAWAIVCLINCKQKFSDVDH